jgi:hypothetical protein
LELRGQRDDDWLFPSRNHAGCHIGTRQYARLVDQWIRDRSGARGLRHP